jgi:two-component sensor histidine kinase
MLKEIYDNHFKLVNYKRLDEGLKHLNEDFDVIFLDLNLPDSHGIITFKTMNKNAPDLPIIILTGLNDEDLAINIVSEGAQDYLVKDQIDKQMLSKSIKYSIRRKNIENQLQISIEDKELLLRELHHRVKNNLMIISSLLNLQSTYIKDEESKKIFKDSQNRARSMALIHERLYQSTDLKRIDFGDYIRTLANDIYHTYVMDTNLIKLNVDVEDIRLDIDISIPLGLILNELVTNSLKHAFPQGSPGEIDIILHTQDKKYLLEVKDNGIGFTEDIDYKNTDSLGLRLVTNLTDQIEGEIEFNNKLGTSFKIIFKDEKFE